MFNMKNETFDKIRFIAEVIGHIVTFACAVSEIMGFKYGIELAAISAALMTCVGGIVETARRNYEGVENESLD